MKIKRCNLCGKKPKKLKYSGFYGYFCDHGEDHTWKKNVRLQLRLAPTKEMAIEDWNNYVESEE